MNGKKNYAREAFFALLVLGGSIVWGILQKSPIMFEHPNPFTILMFINLILIPAGMLVMVEMTKRSR